MPIATSASCVAVKKNKKKRCLCLWTGLCLGGDEVVPEMSARLEGAQNITLAGDHSLVGSDDVTRPCNGLPAPLDRWVHHLQG